MSAVLKKDPIFVLEDWSSPLWRLEHLYWVVDDRGQEYRFHLRDVQREYIENFWSRNLCLKSRQLGMSTLISLIQLDSCLFNRNHSAATICDTKDNARKMFINRVRYPWMKLPEALRSHIPLIVETSEEFRWANGSNFAVTTSARSGTLQSLHISEYGKICAKYPERAKEILTGSIPAVVQDGGIIHIESTAEGADGDFYSKVMRAKESRDQGNPLTILDYRLHFFAWWRKPYNVLDPQGVAIGKKLYDYFAELRVKHDIALSPRQMAWYAKTSEEFGELMKREHPSTEEEAFEASIEGAILQEQMAQLRRRGGIGNYPYDPRFSVNTFWDFGLTSQSGQTVVWYHQRVDGMNRFIDLDAGTDRGIGEWVNVLRDKPYVYDKHYMPFDVRSRMQADVVTTRMQLFQDKNIWNIQPIERVANLQIGIEMLRSFLLTAQFDEKACKDGIRALDLYRREWDAKAERWSDRPLHNWASDYCDAMRQAAQGYTPHAEHFSHQVNQYRPQADEIMIPEIGY